MPSVSTSTPVSESPVEPTACIKATAPSAVYFTKTDALFCGESPSEAPVPFAEEEYPTTAKPPSGDAAIASKPSVIEPPKLCVHCKSPRSLYFITTASKSPAFVKPKFVDFVYPHTAMLSFLSTVMPVTIIPRSEEMAFCQATVPFFLYLIKTGIGVAELPASADILPSLELDCISATKPPSAVAAVPTKLSFPVPPKVAPQLELLSPGVAGLVV